MQPMFEDLLRVLCSGGGASVNTDNSILLVYPPERELEFRDELLEKLVPALEQEPCNFALIDASTLLFRGFTTEEISALEEDEFDDYAWMLKGMSQRVEAALSQEIARVAAGMPGGSVIVYGTMALYPAVRFGDVLPGLRSLPARIAIGFPGEECGGKLHFMAHADGGNYLAVKLFWK